MKLSERDDIKKWMRHEIRCVRSEKSIIRTAKYSEVFPKSVVLDIAEEFNIADLELINELWMLLGQYGYAFEGIKARAEQKVSNVAQRKKLDQLAKHCEALINLLEYDENQPVGNEVGNVLERKVDWFELSRIESSPPSSLNLTGHSLTDEVSEPSYRPGIKATLLQLKYLLALTETTKGFFGPRTKGRKSDAAVELFLSSVMQFWSDTLGREITSDTNQKALYSEAECFAEACIRPLETIKPTRIKSFLREARTDKK